MHQLIQMRVEAGESKDTLRPDRATATDRTDGCPSLSLDVLPLSLVLLSISESSESSGGGAGGRP